MRSTQGFYPICQDDETAVAFVEFVHLHGTKLLQVAGGPWAPHVYVSIIKGVRPSCILWYIWPPFACREMRSGIRELREMG
jgi:hypothetical protein